ncbi:hypothetical protein D7Y04_14190 [Corallococcus sp. AB038B]|nr:hypothetical protein D7Y04_14190 [Corallococcus sp. AB038B]
MFLFVVEYMLDWKEPLLRLHVRDKRRVNVHLVFLALGCSVASILAFIRCYDRCGGHAPTCAGLRIGPLRLLMV